LTFDASTLSIFDLQMKVDHLALEMMLRGIQINRDPPAAGGGGSVREG
jgi:hypothetical protein